MFRSRALYRVLWQQRVHIKTNYAGPCASNLCISKSNARNLNTVTVEDSYVKKFMNAVGWMDQSRTTSTAGHKTPPSTATSTGSVLAGKKEISQLLRRLKLTGYFLYECIPENVVYPQWFESLDLPDTFASWFTITELHVWLLMVRYMAEDVMLPTGEKKKYIKGDGHFVRNCIIEALWADVGNKIKLLEGANPAIARKQVSELSEQFQAALVAYDEGLSDDKVLAAAVWRRFYSLADDVKAEHIERLVNFIRHQIAELDKIASEDLKSKPNINWLSISNH